jgi:hypothetical protein
MGKNTTSDEIVAGRGSIGNPARVAGGFFTEGVVHDVVAGGVRFTLPTLGSGSGLWGPAPWDRAETQPGGIDGHTHAPTPPPAGARCLVVFVTGVTGEPTPWVVQWWVG